MKKIKGRFSLRSILLFVGVILLIDITVRLWFSYKLNLTFSSFEFNNIVTPIVTVIAAFIYYYTLREIKEQNNNHISSLQYAHFKQKIEMISDSLREMNFNSLGILVDDELKAWAKIEVRIGDYKLFNGLNYRFLYETLISKIYADPFYKKDLENDENHQEYLRKEYYKIIDKTESELLRPISRQYDRVANICREISMSDINEKYKLMLFDIIIKQVLETYLAIMDKNYFCETIKVKGKKFSLYANDIVFKRTTSNGKSEWVDRYSLIEAGGFKSLYNYLKKAAIIELVSDKPLQRSTSHN